VSIQRGEERMAKVGPVVVGTDFSESAGVALVEGRRLAALLQVPLHVVHVVDGKAASGWGADSEAGAWLRSAGLAVDDLVIRFGSPWVELARYASDVLPSLVVVGSHGRSGYQPLGIGSTSARISVQARCPVVLVSPRVAELAGQQEQRIAAGEGAAVQVRQAPGIS
jgi:nucleotide-binding universal stress UspA family protein